MEKSWWNTMRASREHLENIHILPGCSKRLTSGSCAAAQSPISQQECRSRNKQTVDDARSWSFLLALLFSSTQLENKSWKILGSFCGGIGETGLPLSSGWSYQEMIYFNNKTNFFFSNLRGSSSSNPVNKWYFPAPTRHNSSQFSLLERQQRRGNLIHNYLRQRFGSNIFARPNRWAMYSHCFLVY